jgi:hypothetical protein
MVQRDNEHDHELALSTFHRHSHSWRPVLFCPTAFNASSRSNSCNLIHWVGLLALDIARSLSSYDGQHKKNQSTAWLEFDTKILVHKGRSSFREDPILLNVIYLRVVRPMKKSTQEDQEHKMNCNTWLDIYLRSSFWLLKQSVQPVSSGLQKPVQNSGAYVEIWHLMKVCFKMVKEL